MISDDSDLARAHPEWMLTPADAVTWRFQHVLDLTHPDAWQYIHDRLDALLAQYPIAALKWDHNRDLLVPRTG
ncbi:alpha-galactosidase, partial [Acinetobacter baumannii]